MYCKHQNVVGNCLLCDTDSNNKEREVIIPLTPVTDFQKVLFLESYIKFQKHKMEEQEKEMMQILENFETEVNKRVVKKMEADGNIQKLINENNNLKKENENHKKKNQNQTAELKILHQKAKENKWK